MIRLNKVVATLVWASLMTLTAQASIGDYIFTYDYEGATHDLFGIQRNVGIDAAMLLKDPSLVGSQIIGVSVDVPYKEGLSCDQIASAWLTKELQVAGEYNLPDLQQVNGEIKNYGTEDAPVLRLDLTFPEPYTLTEEGVYVGYSLTVTNCNIPGVGWTAKYPITTVCDIDKPECMMIHCTKGTSTLPQKYPEWTDLGESLNQALAMRVILRGQIMENAASLEPLQTLYAEPGATGMVYANLNNHGTNPVSSIEYSYTVEDGLDSHTYTKDLTFDTPITGQVGAYTTLDLPLDVPETLGQHFISLQVNKVNGCVNEYTGSTKVDVEVVPYLPANRPLIEDYTGMWCKYCPEVYVTLKQMCAKYGEAFLPLTYHVTDQLQGVVTADLPSSSYGLPKVYMDNRSEEIEYANLESLWLFKRRQLAPAGIDVKLYWGDEAHTSLKAESTVKFIYDNPDANYKLAYALVEDDMSDPAWRQDNAYSNSDFTGPYWDLFVGKGPWVKDLVYDDVVVLFPDTKGIEGSLPSEITGGKEYKHVSDKLNLQDAVCQYPASTNYNKNLIKDPEKLRVVAILIDGKTGNVCNAATTGYSKDAPLFKYPAGVDSPEIESSEKIVSTEYFTMDGLPCNGESEVAVMIKVEYLDNGAVRSKKVFNRKN